MNQNAEQIKKEELVGQLVITQIVLPPVWQPPCVHHVAFAEYNRLPVGVVGGWIDNGYLPTVKFGRYTMINLVQLTENLKQGGVL
jgi:hypothetical protein